jgi:poly(3-hydroxyalkanoate) synthetase
MYAALYPNEIASLTSAAAPIDSHAGDSILADAIKAPMWKYNLMVTLGGGIVHGDFMLANWKAPNAKRHYWDRYTDPSERNDKFYSWYDRTSNLPGDWYRWCIRHIFKGNDLYNNRLVIDDMPVLLSNIKCPVYMIAGERDEISPPIQTFNLQYKVFGQTLCILIPNAGHIGVFMGPKAILIWKEKIFSKM